LISGFGSTYLSKMCNDDIKDVSSAVKTQQTGQKAVSLFYILCLLWRYWI